MDAAEPDKQGAATASADRSRPSPSEQDDERRKELEAAIGTLKQELAQHKRDRDDILERSGLSVEQARQVSDKHIDRLHRYNDIKDAGQILFGKLAELRGKTVKEVYKEYGVDTDD
ncbi:swi5-like zinc finger protein [Coemansia sp. RSA 2599]|nr:swi5-like zinc finger protein [Coemansia sp. RSA 2598]KAJ1821904.1 swi5-like zinc finger protein [Coemansia sp. RSA 2599]